MWNILFVTETCSFISAQAQTFPDALDYAERRVNEERTVGIVRVFVGNDLEQHEYKLRVVRRVVKLEEV